MVENIADDPLTLLSCALSDRIRSAATDILDPEVNAGRISGNEAFQLMLTALTYELIEAGRAIELSDRLILAGVQKCITDRAAVDSEVKH